MTQSFFIPQRLPSLNEWVGSKTRWHYSQVKRESEKVIRAAIRTANLQPMPFAYVELTWTEPTKKRDLDNISAAVKFVLDSLVQTKVLPDDGWNEIMGLTHRFVHLPKSTGSVQVLLSTKPAGVRDE
jgi:Holliday junction resolvase RusA-like endonuclease